jgi:hypothetical protein
MIDNTHDQVRGRRPVSENGSPGIIRAEGHMRSGIAAHDLTTTKKKRRKRETMEEGANNTI